MGGRAVVAGRMGKGYRLLHLANGRTLKKTFSGSVVIPTPKKPPCSTPGSIPQVEVGEEARVEIVVFEETEVREVPKSGTSGCACNEDTPGVEYLKNPLS